MKDIFNPARPPSQTLPYGSLSPRQPPKPLVIPEETYFEGQWIVAPPGTGKTQFIAQQIYNLLCSGENCSIIVIDSQDQLIPTLSHLKMFAQGQPDQDNLVLIDANDVEFPVAFNIFDLGLHRGNLTLLEKERQLNTALETMMFLMDSLLGSDLTGKQQVVFRFIVQAMFEIPDATIYTLKELLSKGGYEKYKKYLDKLEGAAGEFFRDQFNDKQFTQTKDEIVRRLYGILGIRQWERMFNNPKSKFDLFTEMNAGKMILINTSKALLQQKGCEALGRFFLCLLAIAAQRRATLPHKIPVYVFVDEVQDYLPQTSDSNFLVILEQARKQRVSITCAHQYLSQLSQRTIETLQGVAMKRASSLTDRDAHTMARGMRTKPEFLEQQPRFVFATYVRNLTPEAVPIKVEPGLLDTLPKMTEQEYA
jgi:hypothetical protein